ncbi:MAG: PEGA domain-containing protein [Myxococcota bacterium]|nr:PEGA domain-containing protein [Myxococcota bacterium]
MKVCPHCSTIYDDRVDFCFRDGTPLEKSVAPAVPSAADLPGEPPGAGLPTPGLKPTVAGGALSIAGMLDVPEPRFAEAARVAEAARDSAKSAPVTRAPEPPASVPEENLDEPEPLETPAAAPLSEPALVEASEPDVDSSPAPESISALDSAASEESAPVRSILEEDLAPPVTFTEDAGIDTDALPPLSEAEEPSDGAAEDPADPVPAVAADLSPEPPISVLPPYVDEPEEESSSRGGLLLLVGAVALLAAVATFAVIQMSDRADGEPVATAPAEPAAPSAAVVPEPPSLPPVAGEAPVEDAEDSDGSTADETTEALTEGNPDEPDAEEPDAEEPDAAASAGEGADVAEAVEEPVKTPRTPTRSVTRRPTAVTEPVSAETDSPWGQEAEEAPATAELSPGSENMWGTEDDVKQGTLSIATNPAGAVVWLGTKRLGSAPVSTTVDFGSHTIKVELDGYRTEIRAVDMQSGELAVPFELKPIIAKGTVHIFGKTGHMIYIDGTQSGTSPVNTTLTPGRHTIRVVAEDGTSATITAEVEFTDSTTPFIIDLQN